MIGEQEEDVEESRTPLLDHRNDATGLSDEEHAANEKLLLVVGILFLAFAVTEVFASIASSSLSLLGDAMSMVVDVFTYGMNLFAERRKRIGGMSVRTRLKLELWIPAISVAALLVTSAYVVGEAVETIMHPAETSSTVSSIMLEFSIANLLIDGLSVFFFARVNSVLGYNVLDKIVPSAKPRGNSDSSENSTLMEDDSDVETGQMSSTWRSKGNTNMCSAYTHVVADTLRSLAVTVAACIALANKNVNPDLSDAWAAIVVSVIILGSTVPLFIGLHQKLKQLYYI